MTTRRFVAGVLASAVTVISLAIGVPSPASAAACVNLVNVGGGGASQGNDCTATLGSP